MTIVEFHSAAMDALKNDPNEITLMNLTKQAHELCDMVSWADSIIDKDGRVSDAFDHLKTLARAQHEATKNKHVAILHDAISDLLTAIYKHDDDLTPSKYENDDSN